MSDNAWTQVLRGTGLIAVADVIALIFFFRGLEQPWGAEAFLAMTALQIAAGIVCLIEGTVSSLALGALDVALGTPYLLRYAVLRHADWFLPVMVISVSILMAMSLGIRPGPARVKLAKSLRPIVILYALVCAGIIIYSAAHDAAQHLEHPNPWMLGLVVAIVTIGWLPVRSGAKPEGAQR